MSKPHVSVPRRRLSTLALALALALAGACDSKPATQSPEQPAPASDGTSAEPAETGAASVALTGYTREQIEALAESLGEELDFSVEKRNGYLARLKTELDKEPLATRVAEGHITGVAVFSLGQGGLVVKIIKGEGLVALNGGGKQGFEVSAWSIGANAGGGVAHGVMLIDGLGQSGDFGGEYEGSGAGATAATEQTQTLLTLARADVVDRERAHTLHLVSASFGLSADAGFSKLELKLED